MDNSNIEDPLFDLPEPPKPSYSNHRSHQKRRWPLISALVLVVVLGLAAGGWYYLSYYYHSSTKVATTTTKTVAAPPAQSLQPALPPIATTTHNSVAYGLSFKYPSTWTVVDSGSAPMLISSPPLTMTSDNSQSVLGQMVITLAKTNTLPPGFTAQSVAVLKSQNFHYLAPASSQAASSYISFVQYPATNIMGGMDGIYLTGNYGYQKDQSIPAAQVLKISPSIFVSFYLCANAACPINTRLPLTVKSSDWQQTAIQQPILTFFKSLIFD